MPAKAQRALFLGCLHRPEAGLTAFSTTQLKLSPSLYTLPLKRTLKRNFSRGRVTSLPRYLVASSLPLENIYHQKTIKKPGTGVSALSSWCALPFQLAALRRGLNSRSRSTTELNPAEHNWKPHHAHTALAQAFVQPHSRGLGRKGRGLQGLRRPSSRCSRRHNCKVQARA